jgi:hypothetical protein
MVNKDILGGLKVALSKGDSLQSAMQSFYNAGYTKEEIEEAARALHAEISQQQYFQRQAVPTQPQPVLRRPILFPKPTQVQPGQQVQTQPIQRIAPEIKPTPVQLDQKDPPIQTQQPKPQQAPETPKVKYAPQQLPQNQEELQKTKQIVSSYEEPSKYTVDFITVMLIAILLILLGILAAVFFFKPQLVEFLNKFLD